MKNNLTVLFKNILSQKTEKQILGYKKNNKWLWKTRKDLKKNVLNCVNILREKNIGFTDRVIYKGDNSYEWLSWNIAVNSLGGIWVPLYENQSDKYVNYIIEDSKPKLLISNNEYENVDCINNSYLYENYDDEIKGEIPVKDCKVAKLIYTSGTTGNPKGVILSHENIISNYESIDKRFKDFKNRELTTLNILPWAHIFGLTAELYYNIFNENRIVISSGKENFINEIREIQPDILYLVPRVLELIKSKLEYFDKPVIRVLLPMIIKYVFGSNLITIFVGGAQLSKETRNFYTNNNIVLCEGYGCTETSPIVSVNHTNHPRDVESIGKILDNLVVKIVNNEILVSGPSVMIGYWGSKNEEIFEKIDDKLYYKTGDEGYIEDGFLYYTGRIKDNYKLDNGKFVSLLNIENIVNKHVSSSIPLIVYGDNKPYNIIITERSNVISKDTIEKINKNLDSYLQIKNVLYLNDGSFNNYLTPKLSLKRKLFIDENIKEIEEIYK